jgi:lipocalin
MISVTSEGSWGLSKATEMPCSVKKPLALARYTGAWYGIARQLKTG